MGPTGGGNFSILWTFDKVVTLCGKSFFMVAAWITAFLLVISRLGYLAKLEISREEYGRGGLGNIEMIIPVPVFSHCIQMRFKNTFQVQNLISANQKSFFGLQLRSVFCLNLAWLYFPIFSFVVGHACRVLLSA